MGGEKVFMSLSSYAYIIFAILVLGAIFSDFLNAYAEKLKDLIKSLWYGFFKKEAFFLKRYAKSVTVYPDNFAIVVNCYDIKVTNPKKLKVFSRFMDLTDAPHETVFPLPLDHYENQDIKTRFSEFGWWWECSEDGVVEDVTTEGSNSKKAKFNFNFDTSNLNSKKIKNFKIIFAVSVPCLYLHEICSSTSIKYETEEFIFQIGIDKGVCCKDIKFIEVENGTSDARETIEKHDKLIKVTDNFYNKYQYIEKKPKINNQYTYKATLVEDN